MRCLVLLSLAGLAACSPRALGITGPGTQAAQPLQPLHDDAALPTAGVPEERNGYAPSVVPTTGYSGRYFGY